MKCSECGEETTNILCEICLIEFQSIISKRLDLKAIDEICGYDSSCKNWQEESGIYASENYNLLPISFVPEPEESMKKINWFKRVLNYIF
jgi:hypothetical protein